MKITTYDLWPDNHPNVISNGAGSDMRVNFFGDAVDKYVYIYCEPLSDKQKTILDKTVGGTVAWTCTNSCASFASDTFYKVTGIDVDADDYLGIETPREISDSIFSLNGNSNIPKEGLPWQPKRRNLLRELQEVTSSFDSNFLSQCGYI